MEDHDDSNKAADAESKPGAPDPGAEEREEATEAREIGGREGPDPTRYGDWEKNGRCIDF